MGSKLALWTKSASKIWLSGSLFMDELKWHSPVNIVYRRAAANGSLRSATRLRQNAWTAASFRRLLAPPQKLLRRLTCICRYRRTVLKDASWVTCSRSLRRIECPSKRHMRAFADKLRRARGCLGTRRRISA